MTLDTRVFVIDRADPREVFAECQRLLALHDERRRPPEDQKWSDDGRTISNEPMQSLPAWLMLYHRPGEQYRTAEQAAVHAYCNHPDSDYFDRSEPTCPKTEHDPVCWLEVSFDTAYGYRGPDGMGCGDLHAVLVAQLGQWLDTRGIRWSWRNEFTGDVHSGEHRYERLTDLASGGFEASAWFRTSVLPAITGQIAAKGSAQ